MVFFHGGAFVSGSGASALYEGSYLALRGDVVVVTLNYRLGALGFLAHPRLRDPSSGFAGNWGLLDQVAALSWVKEHARSFGGDPTRITVFGESAGGIGICALMAALDDDRSREALRTLGADPAIRGGGGGLFNRAIVESGPPVAVWMPTAAKVAERLVKKLGLREVDREKLSSVPAADLIEAQGQLSGGQGDFVAMPFLPVVDERFLFQLPGVLLAEGGGSGVDLLMGTNKDEVAPGASPEIKGGIEGLVARMATLLERMEAVRPNGAGPGEHARQRAREIVEGYLSMASRRGESQDVRALSAKIATDWVFRMPALRVLDGHARCSGATYSYLFTWESPLMEGALGSCHALELPFVFGTLGHPVISMFSGSGQQASELSEKIQHAWASFAWCGKPEVKELGEWRAYDLPQRATMVLGKECKLLEDPNREERLFWESLGGIGRLEEPPSPGVEPSVPSGT
jgi:para-nitrobenzyl esterase